jgi:hypothetical protein
VHFLDDDRLSGEDLAEIDILVSQTDAAAADDHDGAWAKHFDAQRGEVIGCFSLRLGLIQSSPWSPEWSVVGNQADSSDEFLIPGLAIEQFQFSREAGIQRNRQFRLILEFQGDVTAFQFIRDTDGLQHFALDTVPERVPVQFPPTSFLLSVSHG